jgi:hypothetical protein
MTDERLQTVDGVGCRGDCALGPFQDLGETALLDQREQVFFAADVVVHPGERHAAGGGQVPHGRGVVALVRKDPGGTGQQMVETLVVGPHGFSNKRSNSQATLGAQ